MRRKGFEPPTYWFVASYSIQLSYRRISRTFHPSTLLLYHKKPHLSSPFEKNFPGTVSCAGNLICVITRRCR